MYKTEKDFVQAFIAKAKRQGLDVTRVENHNVPGFPDVYVQGIDWDDFLEFKNETCTMFKPRTKVKWRAGQQAWMLRYESYHKTKVGLTLISFADGVAIIRHNKYYEDSIVYLDDTADCFCYTSNEWQNIKLNQELRMLSAKYAYKPGMSLRLNIVAFAEQEFGKEFMQLDWDPQVVWDAACDQLEGYNNNEIACSVDLNVDKTIFERVQLFLYRELYEVYKRAF